MVRCRASVAVRGSTVVIPGCGSEQHASATNVSSAGFPRLQSAAPAAEPAGLKSISDSSPASNQFRMQQHSLLELLSRSGLRAEGAAIERRDTQI